MDTGKAKLCGILLALLLGTWSCMEMAACRYCFGCGRMVIEAQESRVQYRSTKVGILG